MPRTDGNAEDGLLTAAVGLAAMLYVKDQDYGLVVADLVQDPPVTGPHSPGPRIPD